MHGQKNIKLRKEFCGWFYSGQIHTGKPNTLYPNTVFK